ncbi:MAG TPA: hypothetical protein VLE49_19955, partial [Anaerolineales bacterium]|nr:hypothetical protein [Anaerolineales bacterium]
MLFYFHYDRFKRFPCAIGLRENRACQRQTGGNETQKYIKNMSRQQGEFYRYLHQAKGKKAPEDVKKVSRIRIRREIHSSGKS